MTGSAGFNWTIGDEKIFIVYSLCRNGSWLDWDYDEDNPPFLFRKREKDLSEYYEQYYYSGIEFRYINDKIKIIMKPEDLKSLEVRDAIKLLQALKLPCDIPAILRSDSIEGSLYWVVDKANYKSMVFEFKHCNKGKWTNIKIDPKCEFLRLESDEEDEEDSYYYIFNSGIEFSYLEHTVVLTTEDLNDLDVDAVSILLQVLNLDAS